MTNSEFLHACSQLEALEAALSPHSLQQLIDIPLETAAEPMLGPRSRPVSSREFNRQIADFVAQVCAAGSRGKRSLSQAEAFAVAVQALGDISGLRDRMGYDSALLTTVHDGSQEINVVFVTILEGIKQREKADYVRWRCCSLLDSLDWRMKCQLVETIVQVHRSRTGAEVLGGDPARFAGDLLDLVSAYLESVQNLKVTRSPSAETSRTSLPLSW